MSRETRELRPFDVPEVLEELFTGTRLHIGPQTIERGDGTLVWSDPKSYGAQEVTLEWASEGAFEMFRHAVSSGAQELGIEPAALSIVVFATSGYLGTTDVAFQAIVGDTSPSERVVSLVLPDRPVALRVVGRRPNRIDVLLLLNRQVERRTLRPWRKGTWLARCEFRIGLEAPTSLFRPIDLTDTERKRFGLLSGAVRYLDRTTCDPVVPLSPDDPPRFYVDSEILQTISRAPNSPLSQLMQRELAAGFIRSVLAAAVAAQDEWQDRTWGELQDTLLGRIVRYLEGDKGSVADYECRLSRLRTESDAEREAANAEHSIGSRASILAAFQRVTES